MRSSRSRHRSASSPRCAARWGRDWERLPTDPTRYRLICPKLCTCDKLTRRAKFRFAADPNHQYIHCVPSHSEGRLAIVTNAGRDAVDAAASGTRVLTNDAISGEAFRGSRIAAYGEDVWFWHPDAGVKFASDPGPRWQERPRA